MFACLPGNLRLGVDERRVPWIHDRCGFGKPLRILHISILCDNSKIAAAEKIGLIGRNGGGGRKDVAGRLQNLELVRRKSGPLQIASSVQFLVDTNIEPFYKANNLADLLASSAQTCLKIIAAILG